MEQEKASASLLKLTPQPPERALSAPHASWISPLVGAAAWHMGWAVGLWRMRMIPPHAAGGSLSPRPSHCTASACFLPGASPCLGQASQSLGCALQSLPCVASLTFCHAAAGVLFIVSPSMMALLHVLYVLRVLSGLDVWHTVDRPAPLFFQYQ